MKAHEASPGRTIVGGALFIALSAAPILALLAIAALNPSAAGPAELARTVIGGLSSANSISVAVAAWILGLAFSFWLIVNEHLRVSQPPASQRARWRSRWMEAGRTLLIVAGGALIIYGALSLLYSWLAAARPDLMSGPRLPLSFAASLPCLGLGGAAYSLGRFNR